MSDFNFSTLIETEEYFLAEVKKEKTRNLVVYNDDVNTFDFVIDTLVEICNHNIIQAEQCTFLVHYKGKCVVKTSDQKTLEPLYNALNKRGLTATIE